jgi:hypothetical protein
VFDAYPRKKRSGKPGVQVEKIPDGRDYLPRNREAGFHRFEIKDIADRDPNDLNHRPS